MNDNHWAHQVESVDNVWQDEKRSENDQMSISSNFEVSNIAPLNEDNKKRERNDFDTKIEHDSFSLESNVWNDVQSHRQPIETDEQKKRRSNTPENVEAEVNSSNSAVIEMEDFDDDFGAFEEIAMEKLEIGDEIENLLNTLMPTTALVSIKDGNFDKSVLLIDGGVRPMKCYNTITSADRQYLSDKVSYYNTTTRGCVEVSRWFKELTNLCNEWISDEKGITNENEESKKSSWKEAGKINVFKWSTKIDITKEEEHSNNKVFTERKRIGDKLLAASYKEANAIMAKRMELERLEKLKNDQLKLEREERLKVEKQKREEEKLKYNQVRVDDVATKRKKNLFGSLFKGKSKISKDHISHDKVILAEQENDSVVRELSLKEQMELEGYTIDEFQKKKKKGKSTNRRKDKHTDEDNFYDDDDNDDDDDESGMNDFVVGGYNIIGESEAEIDLANVLLADTSPIKSEIDNSVVPEDADLDDEFGSFAVVTADKIQNKETINDSFENFKSADVDNHTSKANGIDLNSPKNDINLIDL